MSDRIALRIEDGIAEVMLARPDKLNAVDLDMFRALSDTAASLSEDDDLRVVVLGGHGRSFCAGIDLASLASQPHGDENPLFQKDPGKIANLAQQAAWAWRELPVPVIAALHGHVFGAGAQIALGADIRIASPDIQFSIMEMRWGIIPDMSGTQTLRDLVPYDKALELALTTRAIDGHEAAEIGIVTRVSDDALEDARALAREVASRPPGAVRDLKRLFHETRRSSYADGLVLEEKIQKRRLVADDHRAAVAKLAGN